MRGDEYKKENMWQRRILGEINMRVGRILQEGEYVEKGEVDMKRKKRILGGRA